MQKAPNQMYDSLVPEELKLTQLWFGSIIERPIDLDNRMMPLSPKGNPMEDEAAEYISPSPTLQSHERMEIYNQQYWWRLLNLLHEVLPLLTRLFGYTDFNQRFGFPYICRYRPEHWSLSFLSSMLPRFLKETYWDTDRPLIIDAASIDHAYNDAFFARQMPSVSLPQVTDTTSLGALLNLRLYLQPHVRLFDWPYHLFNFRTEFIKPEDGDHWLERPFPDLEQGRRFYFILFRNHNNHIEWKELAAGEFRLLRLFNKGCSASAACNWLEKRGGAFVEVASKNLHSWFQEWVLQGILTPERPPSRRSCFPDSVVARHDTRDANGS